MRLFKKLFGIFMGTIFMGLGVAFYKLSSLGQDSLSGMVMSIQYLINQDKVSYSVCYFSISFLFLIFMFLFLKDKIHIGTIASMILCGVFCDVFTKLFGIFHMLEPNFALKVIYGILGLFIVCFGIAFYGSANLGIAPYDSLPLILSKYCPKIRYKYARIALDVFATFIAFVVGVLILKRTDIININTILSFIAMGPLISWFSGILNKRFYREDTVMFD